MSKKARKIKNIISICLSFIIFFIQSIFILPNVYVQGDELTTKIKFIQDVDVTHSSGDKITTQNPLSRDAEIRVIYKFKIPGGGVIKSGDTYVISTPANLKIENDLNFKITLDNGDTIADALLNKNGRLTITFTDLVSRNEDAEGFFYLYGILGVGNEVKDKDVIEFNVGSNSQPIKVEVDVIELELKKASLKKSGQYNGSKNEITWTLVVNEENYEINKGIITDTLIDSLTFIKGSLKINNTTVKDSDYNYNESTKKLTYTLPSKITSKTTITFKTEVTDNKIFDAEDKITQIKNTAQLSYDKFVVNSNESVVNVKVDSINKTGRYDRATHKITWTIYINNNSRTMTNLVVTDDIPDGLELIVDSLKLDGKNITSNFQVSRNKLTYRFQNTINEPHKIEFQTLVVNANAYNTNRQMTFENIASLDGGGVPSGSIAKSPKVGVYTSVIKKQGIGYNRSTGEITWKIIVNENKIKVQNPIVTDTIPIGQEYVEGSFSISRSIPGGNVEYVKSNTRSSSGILTYKFIEAIDNTYEITFKTRITDPNIYASNITKRVNNTVSLSGSNIQTSSAQGYQDITSKVIEKSAVGYDYITREATWKIRVNDNKMNLSNIKIEDTIDNGQEFIKNSVTIDGKISDVKYYSYDNNTKKFTYNFINPINEAHEITFKTKISDTIFLSSNTEVQISNSAKLINDKLSNEVLSNIATLKIKNALINKEAEYTRGNNYIDWVSTINDNMVTLKNASISDIIQEGLEIDLSSIKLYKRQLQADGSLIKGNVVPLNSKDIKYTNSNRELTINIPDSSDAYLLTFRTSVIDKSKGPFTNTISFKGQQIQFSKTTSPIYVYFNAAGSGGVGSTGSIQIIKVDNIDETRKLQGAIFELLDKNKQIVKVSNETDSNGETVISGLKFDTTYYIREKEAPEGYMQSLELYEFKVGASGKSRISYTFKNAQIIEEEMDPTEEMEDTDIGGPGEPEEPEEPKVEDIKQPDIEKNNIVEEKHIDNENILPVTGMLIDNKLLTNMFIILVSCGLFLIVKRK